MASKRVLIKSERTAGVVKEWKGKFGWITPLAPINHVEAKKHDGKLYVAQADLVGMQFLKPGTKVDYIVYTDGTGLGAQQVKTAGATPHAPKGPPPQKSGGLAPTAKFGQKPHPPAGKPGMLSPASKSAPQKPGFQNGAKGVMKTINKFTPQPAPKAAPAKGFGKGGPVKQLGTFAKNTAASGRMLVQSKDKKYLFEQKQSGLVEKWFGKFGWIKPFNAVKHPMAEKHKGMLYCNKRDLVDCETLKKGQKVEFFVYTDGSGIGCDKVKPKGQPPQQQAAKVPEKAEQKPVHSEPNNSNGKAKGKGSWVWQPLQTQKPGQPQQKPGQPPQKPGQPQQKPGQPQQKPGQPQQKPGQPQQKPGQPQQKPGQPQWKPGQPQQRPGQPAQKPPQQAPKAAQPGQKAALASNGKANGKGKGNGKGGFQWNGGAQPVAPVQKTIEKPKFGNAGKGNQPVAKFGNAGKGSQPVAKAQAPKGPPPSNIKKTLPPNWQEHWSDEHSVPYFWNKVTKESRWVKPFK